MTHQKETSPVIVGVIVIAASLFTVGCTLFREGNSTKTGAEAVDYRFRPENFSLPAGAQPLVVFVDPATIANMVKFEGDDSTKRDDLVKRVTSRVQEIASKYAYVRVIDDSSRRASADAIIKPTLNLLDVAAPLTISQVVDVSNVSAPQGNGKAASKKDITETVLSTKINLSMIGQRVSNGIRIVSGDGESKIKAENYEQAVNMAAAFKSYSGSGMTRETVTGAAINNKDVTTSFDNAIYAALGEMMPNLKSLTLGTAKVGSEVTAHPESAK